MTQAELAAKIAEDAGISKAAGNAVLKGLVEEITKRLKKGEEVRIAGLGTFRIAKRGARTARNPRTGEAIKVKASKQPKFSASATLKNAVNPTRGGEAAKGASGKAAAKGARTRAAAKATARKAETKPATKTGARRKAAGTKSARRG